MIRSREKRVGSLDPERHERGRVITATRRVRVRTHARQVALELFPRELAMQPQIDLR